MGNCLETKYNFQITTFILNKQGAVPKDTAFRDILEWIWFPIFYLKNEELHSETYVSLYQITWRHILGDIRQDDRSDNFKSYKESGPFETIYTLQNFVSSISNKTLTWSTYVITFHSKP
jgi:hypothetical protein